MTGGASGNVIQNNSIGVAADGKTALGNGGDGILLDDAPGTQIGGTDQGEANVIGCNQGNGINITNGTAALVVGNFIGTDPTATLKLGNAENGVNLASSSNTIGGTLGRIWERHRFQRQRIDRGRCPARGKRQSKRDSFQLDLRKRRSGDQPG